MSQVLSNLLGNAIQHGDVKSPVIVSAKGDRDGVELSVHNEGTAIPPKMLPRLFDAGDMIADEELAGTWRGSPWRSTRCGFPARASPVQRERSVDGIGCGA